MKCLTVITTSLALLAGAATAAPVGNAQDAAAPLYAREPPAGPLLAVVDGLAKVLPPQLSNFLLNGVAEIFKGGDAVLNNGVDGIETTLKGRPDQAIANLIGNVVKLLGSLPKDAANITGLGKKLTGDKE